MATFEYEGKQITVLTQEALELGDLAFISEHYGITGLVHLENGMAEMDPGSWRAILIASIRRTKPDVDPADAGIDSVAILPLVEELNRERSERLDAQEKAGGGRPTSARRTRARAGKSG
jgi:hypothetical protein